MEKEIEGQEGQEQATPLATEQVGEAVSTPPVEDFKAKYQESEARRKGQDREISKLQELLKQRDLTVGQIASIEKRVDALATILTEEPESEFEEKPKPSKRERYEQLRKEPEITPLELEEIKIRTLTAGARIAARITKAGLDPNGAEFKAAQETFGTGKIDEADQMVDDIIFASLKATREAKTTAAEVEQAKRREQLKSETGTGGPLSTFKQIEEAYADGQVDYATYKKARQQKGLS